MEICILTRFEPILEQSSSPFRARFARAKKKMLRGDARKSLNFGIFLCSQRRTTFHFDPPGGRSALEERGAVFFSALPFSGRLSLFLSSFPEPPI